MSSPSYLKKAMDFSGTDIFAILPPSSITKATFPFSNETVLVYEHVLTNAIPT
jgi:hypothetical protein